MKNKKITISGYIGKQDFQFAIRDWKNNEDVLPSLWKKRGNKSDWLQEDWPPVKLKITVEALG